VKLNQGQLKGNKSGKLHYFIFQQLLKVFFLKKLSWLSF